MKQKVLGILLVLSLMCGLFPVNASAAYLVNGKHGTDFASGTLAERLETVLYSGISGCVSPSIPAAGGSINNSKAYTTTYANQSGSNTDYQCHAYARAAYSYLFGYNMSNNNYRVEFTDAKGRNTLSYDLFSQYRVCCGAYLRTTKNSSDAYDAANGHSLLILGYDSEGVTTLEGNYNGSGDITVRYYSWTDFNSMLLSGKNWYVCSLSQPTEEIYANLGSGYFPASSPYFVCNVRINCVKGQTVNLYNSVGDTVRADYFSKGQTVISTCGMVRGGAIWYQIRANQNGIPKTFWLKCESEKMTVTNLMEKGPYTLTPKCAPGTRLDVQGASDSDEANIQIYTANGTAAQQWEFTYLGNGYYTIISKTSGKALDVAGASAEAGTNVQQYTPNGTSAQQWMLKDAGDGYYYLVPGVNSGLCLDVAAAGDADETNVGIYTANGTDAQMWVLTLATA